MLPLFDISTLDGYRASNFLPFECEYCHQTFYAQQKFIKSYLKHSRNRIKYCSVACSSKAQYVRVQTNCANCQKSVAILPKELKKSKSGNSFCSCSCAATYNNARKTAGTRRSKLEAWLETKLTQEYKHLDILFNSKEAINSELDIYIPSLKLAFELNGIFHYEPIYGPEKLASIQNNDHRKFQACLERDIELVIIDVSAQKYFKDKTSQKYLDIIQSIINLKLDQ